MCRMLGVKNYDSARHADLVRDFFRLASEGAVPPGNKPGHTDGWGIGYYAAGGSGAEVIKSGGSAIAERERFFSSAKTIGRSPVFLAHFRKSAWPDTSAAEHAHPFSRGKYLFAHNGTVKNYSDIASGMQTKPPSGALDTEMYFYAVLDESSAEPSEKIRAAAEKIKSSADYTALNALFSDGEKLCAYREYKILPGYYTLYVAREGASVFISSEPLLCRRILWRPVAKDEILSF